MFKVSFNVHKNHLGEVIEATVGKVSDLSIHKADNSPVKSLGASVPAPKPYKAKRVKRSNNRHGKNQFVGGPVNLVERLELQPGYKFRGGDLAGPMRAAGMQPISAWYYLKKEVVAGRVNKIGFGQYVVAGEVA